MPNIYSPCTWNMTAAQLVTPTTSQLAAVNAIQAAVTASVNWTVNSTGTTTTGYKYVEVKPSNVNSVYKDYRILFVERVNNATSKTYAGTAPFNTTTNVLVYFAPDGGSSWSTFTPANIETANPPYVGTRYRWGTTSASTYVWASIPSTWTAIWLYECDGAMWIINRASSTSHFLCAIGSVFVPARSTLTDFNEAGTEVGLPGLWQNTSTFAAASITGPSTLGGTPPYMWYQTAPGTKSTVQGTVTPAARGAQMSFNTASSQSYYSSAGGAVMLPINTYLEVSTAANPGNTAYAHRGVYLTAGLQTRTTIQTGSPASTIGYTFFPDDIAVGASSFALAFMNTP